MSGHDVRAEPFEVDKAIASIAYLVKNTEATMYSVMKMLYLADKLHLERYGRFIFGDNYAAMRQGPVPSCAYNMVKHVRGEPLRRSGDEVALQYLHCDPEAHVFRVTKEPDYDELSESDLECLEEVVSLYRRVGQWAIRDLSHDQAWERTWRPRSPFRLKKSIPMPMGLIAADVDETGKLAEHLNDRHPGSAEALSE